MSNWNRMPVMQNVHHVSCEACQFTNRLIAATHGLNNFLNPEIASPPPNCMISCQITAKRKLQVTARSACIATTGTRRRLFNSSHLSERFVSRMTPPATQLSKTFTFDFCRAKSRWSHPIAIMRLLLGGTRAAGNRRRNSLHQT